jgi:Kdo2-lipid IVA lauroyltransferase/acyltransferase
VSAFLARLWIALISSTAGWSVAGRAWLASLVGDVLWLLVRPRRGVTLANLRACFPQMAEGERRALGRRLFRNIARSVLDHSVLWRGSRAAVERLVRVEGAEHVSDPANRPLILLAPHFVGLDAGGLRVNTLVRGVSIYARQRNAAWDAQLLAGRQRFNDPVLIPRRGASELKEVLRAMKAALPFYYLPDMDNGATNSIFVPFFGVPAATIPMVSRLARLNGARVVMAVTEMTDDGYVLHFEAPWRDFPGASVEDDTLRMNREIERWVQRLPDQYLWTHKRFKTRPPGAPPLY